MSGIKNNNSSASAYSGELFQTYNWFEKQEGQSLQVEPLVWKKKEVFQSNPTRRKIYQVEKQGRWTLMLVRTCGYVLLILKELSPGAAMKRSGQILVLWVKKNSA
jgi:hypothetical protein